MKQLLMFAALLSICFSMRAQTCDVLVAEIKGTYEGECKNGKAEGIGMATGKEDVF